MGVHMCHVTGNSYPCASVGGHALWAEAEVQVKETRRQVPRAHLPEVRHGEMRGQSVAWRSGSEWGGRSSWAPPGVANDGLKHHSALYSRDKGQELGRGVAAPDQLRPRWSCSWTEVLSLPGVGLE